MSVTNLEMKQNLGPKNPKEYFTFFQATLLILLTLAISIGGWYAAGKYYFWQELDMKRVGEQLEYLKNKVNADPKNQEYRVALGYTYFLKGDNKQAVKELNQVLEMDKNYYDAYYNLGLIYSDEKRLNDALEMFQKCIEISPRDYKGYKMKGVVYRELKMYKEAVEALDKASKLMPGGADIIYELGRVAEDKGDKDIAIGLYKEALGFDPLYKEAAEGLKRLQKK